MILYVEANGCPNACRHCSADGHPPQRAYYSMKELRALAQTWGRLTIYHEPTAHPDFPAVYDPEIAVSHGGWLVTNGYGLARRADTKSIFNGLHARGIHTIAFTLHGLERHHDRFVCRRGAFADLLLATRRARQNGFQLNWQIFVDRENLAELPELTVLAQYETGNFPQLTLPSHRVSRRLWLYVRLRPTIDDVASIKLAELVPEPARNMFARQPLEHLTAAVWMDVWRNDPAAANLRHPFEPPAFPPLVDFEYLTLYFRGDSRVMFDPMCAPPILIGSLAEGREALLARLTYIRQPMNSNITPDEVTFNEKESRRLHPGAASVRYQAISRLAGRWKKETRSEERGFV